MDSAEGSGPESPLVAGRVSSILEVARMHRTSVEVRELTDLLPDAGPRSPAALSEWIREHPEVGAVVGDRAARPGEQLPSPETLVRRQRGEVYHEAALALVRQELASVRPLVRTAALTGSAAYREPEQGDDLDLMVITRSGALWLYLLAAYLVLRVRPAARRGTLPDACLNYVMDDVGALQEFGEPRGFLFAREALTARPLEGAGYLRGLFAAHPWLAREVPRLFARFQSQGGVESPAPVPAPAAIRLVNALLFLPMSAYLQCRGLLRNRAVQRQGRSEKRFRTVTTYRRLAYQSARFDQLHAVYQPDLSASGALPESSA